ncbi:MAG: OB-fold nucleic acid binding domain-containing protein [Acidimicrobiales bacterium]
MALKDFIHRLTASEAELSRENLDRFCAVQAGVTRIANLVPRAEAVAVGEITSLRIVPRPNGTTWLEATITDGTGSLVAMWTGRRKIAGIKPGRRLVVRGRGTPTGPAGRLLIYNPSYELL